VKRSWRNFAHGEKRPSKILKEAIHALTQPQAQRAEQGCPSDFKIGGSPKIFMDPGVALSRGSGGPTFK
jgi:hypothetical protein